MVEDVAQQRLQTPSAATEGRDQTVEFTALRKPAVGPPVDALARRREELLGERSLELRHERIRRRVLGTRLQIDDHFFPLASRLEGDAREVVRILVRRLQQQRRRDGFGDPLGRRVGRRTQEVDLRHAEVTAAREEHRARKIVPRLVVLDRIADAAVIDVDGIGPEVDRKLGLDAQHVAVAHAPVVRIVVRLQEAVDQLLALLDVAGRRVLVHLLGRGDATADVKIQATTNEKVRGLTAIRREDLHVAARCGEAFLKKRHSRRTSKKRSARDVHIQVPFP